MSLDAAVESITDSTAAPASAAPPTGTPIANRTATTAATTTPAGTSDGVRHRHISRRRQTGVSLRECHRNLAASAEEGSLRSGRPPPSGAPATSRLDGHRRHHGDRGPLGDGPQHHHRRRVPPRRRRPARLETGRFPTTTFALAEPIELGDAPASGRPSRSPPSATSPSTVSRSGWSPLEAQLVQDAVIVVGSLDVTLADYGVKPPDAEIVLSVEDHGILELPAAPHRVVGRRARRGPPGRRRPARSCSPARHGETSARSDGCLP